MKEFGDKPEENMKIQDFKEYLKVRDFVEDLQNARFFKGNMVVEDEMFEKGNIENLKAEEPILEAIVVDEEQDVKEKVGGNAKSEDNGETFENKNVF